MTMVTTLSFKGQTEAALRHYEAALGAEELYLMRFRDAPDPSFTTPGAEDLIFHATFQIHDTVLMASDVGHADPGATPEFVGFALALRFRSIDEARTAFGALADGGEVVMPLAESRFTAWYGIVRDRFGISWKISVSDGDG
ncbi:MAG: VOC family protein [Acidobacteriota bacterium]